MKSSSHLIIRVLDLCLLLPYFVHARNEGSGDTALLHGDTALLHRRDKALAARINAIRAKSQE